MGGTGWRCVIGRAVDGGVWLGREGGGGLLLGGQGGGGCGEGISLGWRWGFGG